MSSHSNPAENKPDPESEKQADQNKGEKIPQRNIAMNIRDAVDKLFRGRFSNPRAIIFFGIGAYFLGWGSFYYNNRHAPPWLAVLLFFGGSVGVAFGARQTLINFHKTDKIANSCLCVILAGDLMLSGLDLYFEYLPPKSPRFEIVSSPVEVPSGTEEPLSIESIRNRMLHTIKITNPNRFPIALSLTTQFPEAIVSVKSRSISEALPDWSKQPVMSPVIGKVITNLVIEPFNTDETTGLWKISLDEIPARRSITMNVLTATGGDGGFFAEFVSRLAEKTNNPITWFIHGDWYSIDLSESWTNTFLIPILFEPKSRAITSLSNIWSHAAMTNKVVLRQGQGFRIPGLLKTKGYLTMHVGGSLSECFCPFQLESTNRIALFEIGVFGRPLAAGVHVITVEGAEFRIGIGQQLTRASVPPN